MAVEILSNDTQAVLFCDTTDWCFGPVFCGDEGRGATAQEEAETFLAWFESGAAIIAPVTRSALHGVWMNLGRDPRDYEPGDLERLYVWWRAARDRTQVPA